MLCLRNSVLGHIWSHSLHNSGSVTQGLCTELYPQPLFIFYFEKEAHWVAQIGLKLVIFLSQPPECCDCRYASPHLAFTSVLVITPLLVQDAIFITVIVFLSLFEECRQQKKGIKPRITGETILFAWHFKIQHESLCLQRKRLNSWMLGSLFSVLMLWLISELWPTW